MSTSDSRLPLQEEAKALRARILALVDDDDPQVRIRRTIAVYAGLLTETLLEYEEPDVVMEQAFFRIVDLLQIDPAENLPPDLLPPAWAIDHDTELGRHMARGAAKRLPKALDDIHEISIALAINDIPVWDKDGFSSDVHLRLLIEMVIASLAFEMAAQDFCDILIESFIAAGNSMSDAIVGLAAVAGELLQSARMDGHLPPDAETHVMNVMVRESLRHGTPGSKDWERLAAANDFQYKKITKFMKIVRPEINEFFTLIDMQDVLSRSVSVAKAVGRMVAVISIEDVGQIHPSVAKSLAKSGMTLGLKLKAAN